MFAFNPSAYHQQQPIDPRERYLSALAEARAAEAEYAASLAQEQARRKQQELAYRQAAAAEAFARKRQLAEQQQYDPYQHLNAIQHQLAALRIQQQKQEHLEAVRLREEAQVQLQREQAFARRLEQQKRQRQVRDESDGSREFLELLFGQQAQVPQQPKVTRTPPAPRQEKDLLELLFACDSTSSPAPMIAPKRASTPPAVAPREEEPNHFLDYLFGGQPESKAPTSTPKPAAAPVQRAEAPRIAPPTAPSNSDIEETVRNLLFSLGVNPADCNIRVEKKPEATSTPAPPAPTPVAERVVKPEPKQASGASLIEQLLQGRAPVEAPEIHHTLQGLFNSLTQPQRPQPNATAGSSKSAAAVPLVASSPSSTATAAKPSLVERLEQRLKNEQDEEVRDTLQGLISSFFASHEPKAAPVAPVVAPEPSPVVSEPSPSAEPNPDTPAVETPPSLESSASDTKGKGKEVEPEVAEVDTPPSPSTADVQKALESIHNIEAAFRTLEKDFIFPLRLDFEPTSPSFKPIDSTTSTTTPKLAYTATNAPVRFYEHALSLLLTQLDAVESFGDAGVRSKRREVVAEIEKALEEVETEVEGRGRVHSRKNSVSSPASMEEKEDNTIVEAPSTVTDNTSTPVVEAEDSLSTAGPTTSTPSSDEPKAPVVEEPISAAESVSAPQEPATTVEEATPVPEPTTEESTTISEESIPSSPSSIASSLTEEEEVVHDQSEIAPSSSDEGGEWTQV